MLEMILILEKKGGRDINQKQMILNMAVLLEFSSPELLRKEGSDQWLQRRATFRFGTGQREPT